MVEKIRYPRLFRAFSWTLFATGLTFLALSTRSSPPTWLPLLVFVPLTLVSDRFAIRMPGDIYLSLETTLHLACALLFGPVTTAWVAGINSLLTEYLFFHRGPHFAARTAGMYILIWLAGGAAYSAVGGEVPLTQFSGPHLMRVFLLLLITLGTNFAFIAADSFIRGIPLATFLSTSLRVILFKTGFAPFGIIGVPLFINFGWPAVLLLGAGFLAAVVTVYELQRTSEKLHQQVAALRLINEVGRMMGSSLKPEPLLNLIYTGVNQLMNAQNFWIALYDPEHNEVEYAILYDEGKPYPPERWPYDPTRYLAAYTIERGQPVFLSTLEEIKQIPIYLKTTGSRRFPESLIAVPILSKGRTIGAISVQSYEPYAFRPEDVETLTALANQAGIALENARLFREVEANQQYLRAILDSVDYAVMVTDLEGRVRLANRAAENLFGFQEREAVNCPLAEVVRHQSLANIAERICRQEVKGRESIQVTLSGERIMATVITPLSDSRGERAGYVVAMADVTPLHRLSELKSQIIRIASHDLRNPLQLASGFFQVLMEELPPKTEMQADLARRVMHHLQAMGRLIDELLELERI